MLIKGETSFIIVNDATNCYDRILLPIAVIAILCAGLPKHAASFMLLFLQSAKHYLLISNKQTSSHYTFSPTNRVDGTGQGTGWSPTIWALVSDILLTALSMFHIGLHISSPDGSSKDTRPAECFVDDAFQGINKSAVKISNQETGQNLTLSEAATQSNQGYERYLTLSGGTFNLGKTIFYYLVPTISNTKKCFTPKRLAKAHLNLTENFSETEISLQQLDPSHPYKLLGIHTEPNDTNAAQLVHMQAICKTWNMRMLGSSLANHQKWLSYSSQLQSTLRYPLPAITATERQLKKAFQAAFPSLKHSLSLPSTSPNHLLTFPAMYGGFGVMDIWIEHLASMARFFLQHSFNQDSFSNRAKALLAYHQLEAGTSGSITSLLGTNRADYLTPSLVTHLLTGLKEFGIFLSIPHWQPPPGESLMDIILAATSDADERFKLNTCRLHAKVHYLSDLLTVDDQSLSIWSNSFHNFSVEATITLR